ncbi:NADH-flavin reductase, partial [Streptococcus pyogenes]
PGQGTGAYRRGGDTLLINHDGTSRITPADLALAVLDELEQPSTQRHFTAIEQAKGLA